jgi:hypothetical protein
MPKYIVRHERCTSYHLVVDAPSAEMAEDAAYGAAHWHEGPSHWQPLDGEEADETLTVDITVEPEETSTVTLRRESGEDITVELGLFDAGWKVLTVLDEDGNDITLLPGEEEAAVELAEAGMDETGRDE